MLKNNFLETAESLIAEQFEKAKCAFIAGSVVRGEATETSDIDLVAIYDTNVLPEAYRKSIVYHDWKIELFVQNTNSLTYFWKKDILCNKPSLVSMIAEGIIRPGSNGYAENLQQKARSILAAGPSALEENELTWMRYMLTDLLDDMESPKNTVELYGTLTTLFQKLGNFYLQANRCWSGEAKSLPRAIKKAFPALLPEYEAAFEAAFNGNTKPVSDLADTLLAPFGGRYWEGLMSYAPAEANKEQE